MIKNSIVELIVDFSESFKIILRTFHIFYIKNFQIFVYLQENRQMYLKVLKFSMKFENFIENHQTLEKISNFFKNTKNL